MLPLFQGMIDRLAGFEIPDALVHGDMHLGNAALIEDRLIFFDWTDASIGPPFFDLMSLNWFEPADAEGPRQAYLESWKALLPPEKLEEAVQLAQTLLNLHHAVSYQHIVNHLEPDSKVELNEAGWFLEQAGVKANEYITRYPHPDLVSAAGNPSQ
jgi:fructosamine-3-kinase